METLKFEGSGAEYFKIWIVNVLLTIVTLGLYYPWAKVRNRRYFHANSTLADRNFEYHATGKQLFVGYLIAMALFITYIIIEQISPIGSMVVLGVLFVAIPWLIWRSLKFNMRMTSFSNVHFSFHGELTQAYMNFFVLPLVLMISIVIFPLILGGLIPSMTGTTGDSTIMSLLVGAGLVLSFVAAFYMFALIKKRNTSYTIDGIQFGQGKFLTNLSVKAFMMITVKTLGVLIVAMVVAMIVAGVIIYATVGLESLMQLQNAANNPEQMAQMGAVLGPVLGVTYLIMIFAGMFVMAYSLTRQRTYLFDNMTLDEKITFNSTLEAMPLAWVMLTNLIAIIVTLGLAFPWAKVRMTRLMLENTQVDTSHGFDAYITQKQKEESSLGEQIGDAFDVDVDVGF